ncbi:pseudouridine synthase [Ideonella sp. DXS29W]|uniref:tRNA pseudouridine synthase C n=1 Tax=Ideonella lacteola TaxID=2984193 RepID=A0ABU9BHW9_9BURK
MTSFAELQLVYRDEDLLVIHKPAGLLVHRTTLDAHETDTVLDRLRAQLGPGTPPGLAPAHRLDKGTSGLLVLACHADAARALGAAFDAGAVAKRYLALVRGWPAEQMDLDHPLARDPEQPSTGQLQLPARTLFQRLARVEWPFAVGTQHPTSRYALVEARPLTGRRHQIRRHLKHLAHPIVGDSTHGKGPHNRAVAAWLGVNRLWLHAIELRLPHPADGRLLHFAAPPGKEWTALRARGAWVDDEGAHAAVPALD